MVLAGEQLEDSADMLIQRVATNGLRNSSTSLSVALAQSLAEAHSGRLMVISQMIGTGSHFVVLLPTPSSRKSLVSARDAARIIEVILSLISKALFSFAELVLF